MSNGVLCTPRFVMVKQYIFRPFRYWNLLQLVAILFLVIGSRWFEFVLFRSGFSSNQSVYAPGMSGLRSLPRLWSSPHWCSSNKPCDAEDKSSLHCNSYCISCWSAYVYPRFWFNYSYSHWTKGGRKHPRTKPIWHSAWRNSSRNSNSSLYRT